MPRFFLNSCFLERRCELDELKVGLRGFGLAGPQCGVYSPNPCSNAMLAPNGFVTLSSVGLAIDHIHRWRILVLVERFHAAANLWCSLASSLKLPSEDCSYFELNIVLGRLLLDIYFLFCYFYFPLELILVRFSNTIIFLTYDLTPGHQL